MSAKPPFLEFLRIVRRTSDFGVLNIINNIFKTTQNLRFWSFCVKYAESNFGVLNIINNILKTTQNLRFWSFCGGRKTSDFGVFAYSTQNL